MTAAHFFFLLLLTYEELSDKYINTIFFVGSSSSAGRRTKTHRWPIRAQRASLLGAVSALGLNHFFFQEEEEEKLYYTYPPSGLYTKTDI